MKQHLSGTSHLVNTFLCMLHDNHDCEIYQSPVGMPIASTCLSVMTYYHVMYRIMIILCDCTYSGLAMLSLSQPSKPRRHWTH